MKSRHVWLSATIHKPTQKLESIALCLFPHSPEVENQLFFKDKKKYIDKNVYLKIERYSIISNFGYG
jgi:hypothetical protein